MSNQDSNEEKNKNETMQKSDKKSDHMSVDAKSNENKKEKDSNPSSDKSMTDAIQNDPNTDQVNKSDENVQLCGQNKEGKNAQDQNTLDQELMDLSTIITTPDHKIAMDAFNDIMSGKREDHEEWVKADNADLSSEEESDLGTKYKGHQSKFIRFRLIISRH